MRGKDATEVTDVSGRVVTVQVARVQEGEWAGRLRRTAIDKRPVEGRVEAGTEGLDGDEQADKPDHGGPDKAVYAYGREDAAFWEAEMGGAIPAGAFGENLTLEGVEVTGAVIGERWRIGSTLLEVRQPRIPCRVLAAFWQVPDLVKRFTVEARPGAYLGVLETGELGAGDAVVIEHRPDHGVTVGQVFRAQTLERELVPLLLQARELPEDVRQWARGVLRM